MQATVNSFDQVTHSGSVYLDDGTELPFGADAFDAGRLRHLRSGQRVTVLMTDGRISYVTLATFPTP